MYTVKILRKHTMYIVLLIIVTINIKSFPVVNGTLNYKISAMKLVVIMN